MFLGKWNEYNMAGMQQDLHSHSNLIVICFVNPVYLLHQAVKCKGSKPSGGMGEVGCDSGVGVIKLPYISRHLQ